jgi:hypothetical protein
MGVAGRDETNLCVVGENGVMVDLELWGPPFFVVISCVGICIGRLRVCFSRFGVGIGRLDHIGRFCDGKVVQHYEYRVYWS